MTYYDIYFGVATGTAGQFKGPEYYIEYSQINNEWHHIAVTYDSSTDTKYLFLDGSLLSPSFTSTTTYGTPPSTNVVVGGTSILTNSLRYYIDELRTSSGIRYSTNFTAPSTPFLSDETTAGLWHFDDGNGTTNFTDSSTNGNHLLGYNGAVILADTTNPPVITTQPQSLTNTVGSSASFTVEATGTAPLCYQWQKNISNIGSATNATYTIDPVETNDAGGYRCVVTNIAGAATSAVATLTVNNPPGIGLSTTLLTYAATYSGSSPAVQTLILTNLGQIAFSYSNAVAYGAQASGWFSLVPVTGLLAGSAGQVLTAAVNSVSLTAGVYYATNTVIASAATNSPQYISVVLTMAKANQAITNFTPTNGSAFATTSTVGLSAMASSDLPVSFAVGSGLASISGGTNLTFTGAGTVSIVASQAGNANWNPAPNVTNTFNVTYDLPAAPTGVTASQGAFTNKVRVAWNTVAGAGGYIVWTNTVDSTNTAASAISGVSAPPWDDTNAGVAVVTYYWVQATNDAGAGPWSSPAASGWRASDSSISVLGTNGVVVTNGEAASAAKGTDFGLQTVSGASLTNTFSITNSGSVALQIMGVTTSGAGAAYFTVTGMPGTVAAGGVSNLAVVFNHSVAGLHTTVVTIANNSTNTPYLVNFRGTCGGEIGLSTTTLAFAGTYGGTAPAASTFTITNLNSIAFNYTNAVTYSSGASGWLSVSPANGSVAGDGAHVITGSVTIGSLNAGVYTATNAVTSTNALNSPQRVVVTLTVNRANQAITFLPIADQTANNTVILSATADSGLPVSFSVGSGPGEISAGATLAFTGAGAVSILANQVGNTNWNAAPNVTNSFNVAKANQAITFPAIPDQMATASVALAATASSGLPVSFNLVSGPGSINSDILTFTSAGVVSVAASQAGNALWNAAPNVTNSVTVHDVSTLAAPQNLAASDGTYTNKVAVTWSAVSGAGGYQVWRARVNNSAAAVNLGNVILSSYDDNSSAVRLATMYYYWVKACNSIATSEFSTVDSGFCRLSENADRISGQPMVGDYDGDNKADPAVYNLANGRLSVWLTSAGYTLVTPVATFQMAAGDLPVASDFDGDRLADPAVFQRLTGSWFIWLSSAGYYRIGPVPFGIDINDTPIPADYDGDRLTDPAVCNAGVEWYVWLSSADYFRIGPVTIFRIDADDIPAPAQFDADALADPAVYQAASGNWYVWLSSAGYFRVGPVPCGTTGDHLAVPADYDGDGLADPAAYVPSLGKWRIWMSSSGYVLTEMELR
ncbi:MAG: choice-of-anchor D domain-containing protein [Kiritimatiellae bacterium]|nr:choice-of-anchor D domain-containing protein [Kiritimatiellia bacterium]